MLCIPTNAIVFDKNKNFVVVYNNKCDIKTREISITDNFGKKTYVSSGLKEGERVISQSQLLIYEALNEQ
jgi:cobalt-zinc-cadmium efflux system membrane fusion protein